MNDKITEYRSRLAQDLEDVKDSNFDAQLEAKLEVYKAELLATQQEQIDKKTIEINAIDKLLETLEVADEVEIAPELEATEEAPVAVEPAVVV